MVIGNPVGGTNLVVSSATGTWNVPYPTSPLTTDALLMRMTISSTSALTTPAGWTLFGSLLSSGSTTPRVALFGKPAAGGESGSLAVTVPSATGQARMYKVPGVDLTNMLDVAARTQAFAATTAYDIPSLTTITAGALLFGTVGSNGQAAGTFLPPTIQGGFTELQDVNTQSHSSDAYVLMGAAGASGIANFVRSGPVRGAGILVALRPAGASPGVTGTVIVGGAKKSVVSRSVIVGGAKKTVVNQWVIVDGVKKTIV